MNKIQISIIVGILVLGVLFAGYNIYQNNHHEFNCYYDKDIALKSAQFKFGNAVNDYQYDSKKADFAIALQYAHCN